MFEESSVSKNCVRPDSALLKPLSLNLYFHISESREETNLVEGNVTFSIFQRKSPSENYKINLKENSINHSLGPLFC